MSPSESGSDASGADGEAGGSANPDADTLTPERHRSRRVTAVVLVAVAAIALCADLVFTSGRIHPRVRVGDLQLGGETLAQATTALQRKADELGQTEIRFHVGEQILTTTPEALGWTPDVGATAAQAMRAGRGNLTAVLIGRPAIWLAGEQVDWVQTWNRATLRGVMSDWSDAAELPVQEGAVRIEGEEVVASDPQPGTKIDVASLMADAQTAIDGGTADATLPLSAIDPVSTPAAVDAAAEQARRVMSGPIRVSMGPATLALQPAELAPLFTTTVQRDPHGPQPVAAFDPGKVDKLLAPYKPLVEVAPKDATVTGMGTHDVSVTQSEPGRMVDADIAAAALFRIATSEERTGKVPLVEVQAGTSTRVIEQYGIDTRLSTFTGYYPSGEARVRNIHVGADVLNGALIEPGETFSLNKRLGERTYDKGYVDAPAIWNGEIVQQVGGGISQLTTTLYNAAFFAGFPIVEHQAHSFWFPRYPQGREATLGWPDPDLKFTNDLDTPVIITTSYTDSSITVSVYGTEKTRDVDTSPAQVTAHDKETYTVAVERTITDPNGKVQSKETFLTHYQREEPCHVVQPDEDPTSIDNPCGKEET